MKENMLKIVITIIAIVIIIESVLFISKNNTTKNAPAELLPATGTESLTFKWGEVTATDTEIPLLLTSTKDVAIDAVDLYIKYDPSMVTVTEAVGSDSFVAPSFNKVSSEKGLVVMNYLVSAASGFQLKSGTPVEIARLKVNYIKDGEAQFELGDGTLVVENATAKVLPFNSNKLVVNVSQ